MGNFSNLVLRGSAQPAPNICAGLSSPALFLIKCSLRTQIATFCDALHPNTPEIWPISSQISHPASAARSKLRSIIAVCRALCMHSLHSKAKEYINCEINHPLKPRFLLRKSRTVPGTCVRSRVHGFLHLIRHHGCITSYVTILPSTVHEQTGYLASTARPPARRIADADAYTRCGSWRPGASCRPTSLRVSTRRLRCVLGLLSLSRMCSTLLRNFNTAFTRA